MSVGSWPDITCIYRAKTSIPTPFASVLNAIQTQITRDFLPIWGRQARLHFGTQIPRNHWAVVWLDDADQAGAEGYHEFTPDGQPLGKVFVRTTMDAGDDPDVTASHELLEMLGDPDVDQTVDDAGAIYAFENCDAVETLSYPINGVQVSDFVYPAWFGLTNPPVAAATQFDYLGKCSNPWQILPGGYMSVQRDGQWTEIFGSELAREHFRKSIKHRPHVRRVERKHRRRSTG